MLLDIDLREALLMIALVGLFGTTFYATYRSTKALKNELAQKPEVPDIVQMASLEEATGFKVVDKDGYQSLQTLNTATSPSPTEWSVWSKSWFRWSRVDRHQTLHEWIVGIDAFTSQRYTRSRKRRCSILFGSERNLRSAIAAIFQRLEEDAE